MRLLVGVLIHAFIIKVAAHGQHPSRSYDGYIGLSYSSRNFADNDLSDLIAGSNLYGGDITVFSDREFMGSSFGFWYLNGDTQFGVGSISQAGAYLDIRFSSSHHIQ